MPLIPPADVPEITSMTKRAETGLAVSSVIREPLSSWRHALRGRQLVVREQQSVRLIGRRRAHEAEHLLRDTVDVDGERDATIHDDSEPDFLGREERWPVAHRCPLLARGEPNQNAETEGHPLRNAAAAGRASPYARRD